MREIQTQSQEKPMEQPEHSGPGCWEGTGILPNAPSQLPGTAGDPPGPWDAGVRLRWPQRPDTGSRDSEEEEEEKSGVRGLRSAQPTRPELRAQG